VAVDRLGGAAASAADAARFADSLVATARVYLGHTQPRYASAPLRVEMNVSVTPPLAFDAASVTGGGAPGCVLATPWLVTCRAETAVEAYTPATSLRVMLLADAFDAAALLTEHRRRAGAGSRRQQASLPAAPEAYTPSDGLRVVSSGDTAVPWRLNLRRRWTSAVSWPGC